MEARGEQSWCISQARLGSFELNLLFFSLPASALVIFLHKFPKSDKGNLLCAHKALGISWRHIILAITLLT